MLMLCVSMDANLQLSTVAAMSLRGVNDKAIFTVRKVVVGHTFVVSVILLTGTDTKEPIQTMMSQRIQK
jgi:hypothetical protein